MDRFTFSGNYGDAVMSNYLKPTITFLKSKGKEFIKIGGGAYFLVDQQNKFSLIEIVRIDDKNFDPPKIISADEVISTIPFINIILPRNDDSNHLKTQR